MHKALMYLKGFYMTKLLLIIVSAFMFTSVSMAEDKMTPWPRITAWSFGVDLTITNYSDDDFSCSGPIFIRYSDGTSDSEYYFGNVYARATERRYFYSRRSRARIVSAYDSIFCHKI